ncbi:hydantoinase/oxoprolinase N-terminal domain-containing protein [Alkalilimnicola ehrlichii]|uniref:hydantoinase/oxoprolinase N-terminal domain-containing protein n=1 Tax=Alkalilimnicola ehrlichii TaxID=351052 RepID=UPI0026C7A658|nr:hydantoinase/oxoprolinase N-terminal domain-containing protein [Alkalilimnicola ehrlichii]
MTKTPANSSTHVVGVDTGGTFTDLVHFDGQSIRTHKVLSTPSAPEQAIIRGVRELGLAEMPITVIHGSTVATNAVLEGKGVRTVFIANRGLGDLLTLGRQNRAELYSLQPKSEPPPVPPELCLETGGRLDANGKVVDPLTEADLAALKAALAKLKPASVAINLLFSFLDHRFEQAIEAIVPDGILSRARRLYCRSTASTNAASQPG